MFRIVIFNFVKGLSSKRGAAYNYIAVSALLMKLNTNRCPNNINRKRGLSEIVGMRVKHFLRLSALDVENPRLRKPCKNILKGLNEWRMSAYNTTNPSMQQAWRRAKQNHCQNVLKKT